TGRTIVMTTTNGTRALRACRGANQVLIASFLNLRAIGNSIEQMDAADLLLICSGTFDQVAYEDILGAGALSDQLWPGYRVGDVADSARISRRLFQLGKED